MVKRVTNRLGIALVAIIVGVGVVESECASAETPDLVAPAAVVPLAPPPPDPVVAEAYANTFHVTTAVAQERLTLEERAGNIASDLGSALGSSYAGVWFDNSTGRFNIAVASPSSATSPAAVAKVNAAQTVASELEVSAATDIRTVGTSLDAITAAQSKIDQSLHQLVLDDELQTAPNEEIDELELLASASASAADKRRIEATATEDGVPTRIVTRPASDFEVHTASCSFPDCGRPIEGGVEIWTGSEFCSAGYLAQGNEPPYHWFVITAGHCGRGRPLTWYASTGGEVHQLGTMNHAVWNIDGDYGRIDITGTWWGIGVEEPFSAFWGINTHYPTRYTGWSVEGTYGCRTGAAENGAQCGTILHRGMTINEGGVEVAGEFEVSACANEGDSGGPFMMNYYAVGIFTALNARCGSGGAVSYYSEVMNAIVPANLNVTIDTIYSGE